MYVGASFLIYVVLLLADCESQLCICSYFDMHRTNQSANVFDTHRKSFPRIRLNLVKHQTFIIMILCAAIVSKKGDLFCSNTLPHELQVDISRHAKDFMYALSIEDGEVDMPYIETRKLRYIYKQTDDLYWLLVTKPQSELYHDIDCLGKLVCTIMEYGSSETNSHTLTYEQKELFYRHVWRPWDESLHCFICNSFSLTPEVWRHEFENRLQFLTSMRNGDVADQDVGYFNGLLAESWAIAAKLSPRWTLFRNQNEDSQETDSACSDDSRQSISEESVIDNCRLKCRLDDIRVELTRIQDPYLRLFARRDLLVGSCYNETNGISSAPALKEIESNEESCEHDLELTKQM